MEMEEDKKEESMCSKNSILLIGLTVLVIIIGLWVLTRYLLKDLPSTDRGTYGDMFGSINALFSGMALAGIIITILLQRQELQYQRDELRETRREFKTQNETLKIQRFENTFFNLLNLHHQIVNAMDYQYTRKETITYPKSGPVIQIKPATKKTQEIVINGRDVFRYLYNKMNPDLTHSKPEGINEIYKQHYDRAHTDFGHYFRNLYRMIKLVHLTDFYYDTKNVTEIDVYKIKYKYTSIIRAQLSDYELIWLFYNCQSEYGREKFKPLIERYCIFKNLPEDLLASPVHKKLYSESAFRSDMLFKA